MRDELLLVGDGVHRYRELFEQVPKAEIADAGLSHPSAASLVQLAHAQALREEFQQPADARADLPPQARRRDQLGHPRAVREAPRIAVVPMRRRHLRGVVAHRAADESAAVVDGPLPSELKRRRREPCVAVRPNASVVVGFGWLMLDGDRCPHHEPRCRSRRAAGRASATDGPGAARGRTAGLGARRS